MNETCTLQCRGGGGFDTEDEGPVLSRHSQQERQEHGDPDQPHPEPSGEKLNQY